MRQAETLTVLTTLICNRSRDIIDYTQAALAFAEQADKFVSLVFPILRFLTALLRSSLAENPTKKINDETLVLQPTQEECEAVADLIPDHILILPLRSASKGPLGHLS